jgi:glucan biosynthesis protein C
MFHAAITKGRIEMNAQPVIPKLTSNRLVFFDNLRIVLIIMVITHHVAQAYGPTGAWWPVQESTRAEILGPFFMVNRSFGMSLFFMIAGYFTARSCDRSGSFHFMRNRLQRLGIPLLGFSLLMILLQVFLFGPLETGELGAVWPIDVIHFWFVQHLLLYSLGYAVWWWLSRRAVPRSVRPMNPPGYGTILLFAVVLTLMTAIMRTWYDIDQWVYLFGYIRIAPADVPRDLGLFLIGTLVYRKDWVTRYPSEAGHVWLAVGIGLAGLWYVYDLWLADILVFSDAIWGLLLPLWETLLCSSLCIGLTVVFRNSVNTQTSLTKKMSQSTYAAYMFHVFIAIFFQFLALGLATHPLLKFFLVSLVTVPVSFILAGLIRRPLRL